MLTLNYIVFCFCCWCGKTASCLGSSFLWGWGDTSLSMNPHTLSGTITPLFHIEGKSLPENSSILKLLREMGGGCTIFKIWSLLSLRILNFKIDEKSKSEQRYLKAELILSSLPFLNRQSLILSPKHKPQ